LAAEPRGPPPSAFTQSSDHAQSVLKVSKPQRGSARPRCHLFLAGFLCGTVGHLITCLAHCCLPSFSIHLNGSRGVPAPVSPWTQCCLNVPVPPVPLTQIRPQHSSARAEAGQDLPAWWLWLHTCPSAQSLVVSSSRTCLPHRLVRTPVACASPLSRL
jgi:hypothetical protein